MADEIFHIVMGLQYPEDLMEWFEINEMIDMLKYDNSPLEFNEKDVKLKIIKEAKLIVEANE
ncbi:hypothetical protein [Gracilibacillus saliphilus]|uniref:hypothetical protein n=1 Tax=Gracilibacillus saliphilus TaxID=543890 RepID=UPI0013D152EB|nr:hypothetical protein [Gracilibacillus saliphilus]